MYFPASRAFAMGINKNANSKLSPGIADLPGPSTNRPARFCMSGSLTDRERRLKGRARLVSVVIIIMAVKQ